MGDLLLRAGAIDPRAFEVPEEEPEEPEDVGAQPLEPDEVIRPEATSPIESGSLAG